MNSSFKLSVIAVVVGVLVLGWTHGIADEGKKESTEEKNTKESKEAAEPEYEKDENGKPVKKDVYVIQIKDHQFSPAKIVVPAGQKIKLRIENLDATPEEFESHDLNREKIVTGGGKITIYIGPLKPGTYKYFGEFHEDTAQGVIIAK